LDLGLHSAGGLSGCSNRHAEPRKPLAHRPEQQVFLCLVKSRSRQALAMTGPNLVNLSNQELRKIGGIVSD
jgi:hypothetical protein